MKEFRDIFFSIKLLVSFYVVGSRRRNHQLTTTYIYAVITLLTKWLNVDLFLSFLKVQHRFATIIINKILIG